MNWTTSFSTLDRYRHSRNRASRAHAGLITLHLDESAQVTMDFFSRGGKDAWHNFGARDAWYKDDIDELGKELQVVRSVDLQGRAGCQVLFVRVPRIRSFAIQ